MQLLLLNKVLFRTNVGNSFFRVLLRFCEKLQIEQAEGPGRDLLERVHSRKIFVSGLWSRGWKGPAEHFVSPRHSYPGGPVAALGAHPIAQVVATAFCVFIFDFAVK